MSHPVLTVMVDKTLIGNEELSNELYAKYQEAAEKHNVNVKSENHPDAGFDLFVLSDLVTRVGVSDRLMSLFKVRHGIRCVMMPPRQTLKTQSEAYFLYPRSSVSKTPYRLANSVGIIDSGYRGEIIGMFDQHGVFIVPNNYDRLCQICARNLEPFLVEVKLVDSYTVEDVVGETRRGEGGFGSTGK
jgi:dUTP pyrophosphatase